MIALDFAVFIGIAVLTAYFIGYFVGKEEK